jgi:ribosomal protein S18 acetylase RimI-like enzyme
MEKLMKKLITRRTVTKNDFVTDCNFHILNDAGVHLLHEKGFIYAKSGIKTPLFNAVVRCPSFSHDTDTTVDHIVHYYQTESLPHSWWINHTDLTTELKNALAKHHKKSIGTFPGLSIDVQHVKKLNPVPLSFEDVTSDVQFLTWSQIIADAFELQSPIDKQYADLFLKAPKGRFQHLLGCHQGKAIVSGTVLCHEEFAYIYNLATHKEERNKGYAAAMLVELIDIAKKANCSHVGLVSSPAALPLYKRVGFTEQCAFEIFI